MGTDQVRLYLDLSNKTFTILQNWPRGGYFKGAMISRLNEIKCTNPLGLAYSNPWHPSAL